MKINEKHYSFIYLLITFGIVYVATILPIPAIRILGSSIQSVALWMLSTVGFAFFLNGTTCDIYKEITEEHNTALGLLMGLYAVAMAIVIHG